MKGLNSSYTVTLQDQGLILEKEPISKFQLSGVYEHRHEGPHAVGAHEGFPPTPINRAPTVCQALGSCQHHVVETSIHLCPQKFLRAGHQASTRGCRTCRNWSQSTVPARGTPGGLHRGGNTCVETLTQQGLLSARHYSRCWGSICKSNKRKPLPSWSLRFNPRETGNTQDED